MKTKTKTLIVQERLTGIAEVFVCRSKEWMNIRVAEELHSNSVNQFAGLVRQGLFVQMLDYPVSVSCSSIVTDHEIVEISHLRDFPD